jgi:PAS domain S-box-containing protein
MVETYDYSSLGADEQFALITEAVPALQIETVGLLFFDLQGHITNANRAFQRMSGYNVDELRSMDWKVLTPPEFMEVTRRSAERIAQTGTTPPYEKQLVRKDGSRWWGLFAPTRVSGSGRESQCVEFIIDISETKRQEQRLRAQTRLLDLSSDAIISRDLDGNVVFWNHGAEVLYGWTRHEAMGKHVHRLLKTQWPEPFEKVSRKLLQHGAWAGELIHTTRSGEQKHVFCRKILDRQRSLVLETNTDITELQQMRSELAQRDAMLRSLAREAQVGLVVLSKDLRYLFANQRYAEILGLQDPHVEGKRVEDVVGASLYHHGRPYLDRAFSGERVIYEANVPHSVTRSERFVEVVCEPRLEDSDNPYIVVVITDITDRKLAQQNLERMVAERTAELRQANEHLEAFVYSIAHDLRAPLRAMQGYSHILMHGEESHLSEQEKMFVSKINQSAEFMDKLVLDLLAFGRTASREITFEPVDVQKVWEASVYQCAPDIERTNAIVEVERPLCRVRAHEPTLTQVLTNLLSNAIKFVEPGTRPHVRFGCNGEGRFACMWIEDNGVGIEPQYHDRIFRVFERLHGARFAGTGIGLAIVRKGVERMNGNIGLKSEPGKGTRFWIELPRA